MIQNVLALKPVSPLTPSAQLFFNTSCLWHMTAAIFTSEWQRWKIWCQFSHTLSETLVRAAEQITTTVCTTLLCLFYALASTYLYIGDGLALYGEGGGGLCPLSLSVVDKEKKGNQARAESQIDSVRKIDGRQAEGEKEGTERPR